MTYEQILRYLRISGSPDQKTKEMIHQGMEMAKATSQPKRMFQVYPCSMQADGVQIGHVLFEGEKIQKWLKDCDLCAILAVTLGAPCDQLLRSFSISNPAFAVVLQAVFADYTEDFCDLTEKEIQAANPGYSLGKRFSPGYPGLPLTYQKQIFTMLDITKRIGIYLTDSYLMIPSKSVSAFVGLKKG